MNKKGEQINKINLIILEREEVYVDSKWHQNNPPRGLREKPKKRRRQIQLLAKRQSFQPFFFRFFIFINSSWLCVCFDLFDILKVVKKRTKGRRQKEYLKCNARDNESDRNGCPQMTNNWWCRNENLHSHSILSTFFFLFLKLCVAFRFFDCCLRCMKSIWHFAWQISSEMYVFYAPFFDFSFFICNLGCSPTE